MEVTKLPDGWRLAKLGEIVKIGSRNVDPSAEPERFWNYVALENVEQATGRLVGFAPTRGNEIGSTKARFQEGDVLYGKLRPYLRKAWVAEFDGCSSTDLIPLTPGDGILAEYLKWFLLSPLHMEYIMPLMAGIRMPRLRSDDLFNMPVPLPPIDEQRRIVTRVKEMMDRSRRARGALQNIDQLLSSLMASGLEARLAHDSPRARDEEEFHEWQALLENKRRRVGRKYQAYVEASLPEGLPELPTGWKWVRPDELAADDRNALAIGPFGSNLTKKDYTNEGVPIIFVRHIRSEGFGGTDQIFVTPEKAHELRAHSVRPGDLLVTKMGDPPGDTAVYPEGATPAVITADCIKLTPDTALVQVQYLKYALRSNLVKNQILEATQGVAQQKISLDRFRSLAIPLPPPLKQAAIADYLGQLEGQTEALTNAYVRLNEDLTKLEQSILAAAFAGQLL